MERKEAIEYFYRAMENGNIKNDTQQLAYEMAIESLEKQMREVEIEENIQTNRLGIARERNNEKYSR